MNIFKKHIHNWEIISKTYSGPRKLVGGANLSEEAIQKFSFGVTTLLWECASCREMKKEELLGTDENPLETYMDSARDVGPQVINRDDEQYILMYYPPTQLQQPYPPTMTMPQASMPQTEIIPVR